MAVSWDCFCRRMRFELQERRNKRADDHSQEVFEMRICNRGVRLLRSAGLSGHYLLSVRERRLSRPSPIQTGHFVSYAEVTLTASRLEAIANRSQPGPLHARRRSVSSTSVAWSTDDPRSAPLPRLTVLPRASLACARVRPGHRKVARAGGGDLICQA